MELQLLCNFLLKEFKMSNLFRHLFRVLNKFFMVPMFRLGFGPMFGNPLSGYIMVLKTIGRKTGKVRYVPVNYTIHKGNIYCISGWRKIADWYKNLHANPEVEIMLPGGTLYAHMDEICDPDEKSIIARQVLQNAGFAGFFEGYNPFTISDEALKQKITDLPILRFQPLGLGSGPSDAGGWAWVWSIVATVILIVLLVR
jgi:deazaflavin-dependent oxidoreductase (nitroreductase family)